MAWPLSLHWFLLGMMTLALVACGSNTGEEADTMTASLPVASMGQVDNSDRGPAEGDLVLDFQFTREGEESSLLSDWQGQPMVINFWATWCAPCRAEMPELVDAYEAHKAEGLVVVGVNVQESAEKAAAFVDEFQMTFPVVLDSRGELLSLYQVRGLPSTLFVDRQGRIIIRWAGLLTKDLLESYLSEIL